MGIKGRRVHMIEELSETIISFQRGKNETSECKSPELCVVFFLCAFNPFRVASNLLKSQFFFC